MLHFRLGSRFRLRAWATAVVALGAPGLLPSPWTAAAAAPQPPTALQLQALERAFNRSGELSAVLEAGPGLDPALVGLRRSSLLKEFPDAQWLVSPGTPLKDGTVTTQIKVVGSRKEGSHAYALEALQLLVLSSEGGRINSQRVIKEQSLVHSAGAQLPVSLLIPDAVLTGQRYDVDVVFDDPLDGAVLAGGLSALSNAQVNTLASPNLQIGALGGGGLFKTVQAPLTPGNQTWAVLLVHPKGIVTATKRVRVVADQAGLNP